MIDRFYIVRLRACSIAELVIRMRTRINTRYELSDAGDGKIIVQKVVEASTVAVYHVRPADNHCTCPAFRRCKHLDWAAEFLEGMDVGMAPFATYNVEEERLSWA